MNFHKKDETKMKETVRFFPYTNRNGTETFENGEEENSQAEKT